MKKLRPCFELRVAGGRLASSAQPPRATSHSAHRLLTRPTPQPFRSISFLDTTGALLEGLRCFPAFRPLLNPRSESRKNLWTLSPERNQE
jgi:hypothetical protein